MKTQAFSIPGVTHRKETKVCKGAQSKTKSISKPIKSNNKVWQIISRPGYYHMESDLLNDQSFTPTGF